MNKRYVSADTGKVFASVESAILYVCMNHFCEHCPFFITNNELWGTHPGCSPKQISARLDTIEQVLRDEAHIIPENDLEVMF